MKHFLLACALSLMGSSVALTPGGSLFFDLFLSFSIAYLWHTFPSSDGLIPRTCAKARLHVWRFCPAFIARIFHFVHSNARLLFGIDVAIGVAVGHFTGNALLGGLAGGAWWLLDWHLVSIKLLGVKPA